ncbi:hypothetical protein WJ0W_005235 [Paenibacillus melissococcoides]|uniref:Uncharacterized protein n=1 Tax=Paenibacillus melissococcoides TaxID=2912268 RepID=A0ABN8UDV4_9BACL|nr:MULTISPECIES: hypothetical protein [Paenibacillus]MEB9897045.1 hypothetical protein [Bacillus cereus]CAH8247980.1 hypothetical protein WJ0W_005235 [Paenibacillus melissococcoides]CAH8718969.1 hypothetical protein HTL2_005454 [Paenibacillus melissococcoides]CAH8719976.1 hypothetical protein WDD9_005728 [Paenibacillus melissococcoides]GIO80678.1 hypothetical protein J6TS7_42880 [Paenibacillus dendritiformis]
MNDSSSPKMEHVRKQFQDCMDFQERSFPNCQFHVFYLAGLAGHDELLREVIAPRYRSRSVGYTLPASIFASPYVQGVR